MTTLATKRTGAARPTGAARRIDAARLDSAIKALASEQRREILAILSACAPDEDKTCCSPGEVCACKISERLGLAASTISHHMTLLREAGLVNARKDGLWVYYSLRREALDEVARAIAAL